MNNRYLKDSGFNPTRMDTDEMAQWRDDYSSASIEERMLLESQEQSRLLTNISKHVSFFFWFTIISIVVYFIIIGRALI